MTRVTMASVVVALLGLGGLSACGPSQVRDTGTGGIDANIPRNDAFVMGCGTMAPEDNAAACADSCDNDGNGFADCNDFDCCSVVSCGSGTACGDRSDAGPRADAAVVTCATAGMENTAAACGDGCDNEPDGFADCNDFDCCSLVSCGADTACGRRSMDAGPRADAFIMACATAGMENTAAACGDGCDNEPDGFGDCDDFDCCDLVTCGPSTGCGRRAMSESSAAQCNDMIDNDDDRFIDCDDRDCCGVREMSTCGAMTYIGRGACS